MARLRIITDPVSIVHGKDSWIQHKASLSSPMGSDSDVDSLFDEPRTDQGQDAHAELGWEQIDTTASSSTFSYVEPPYPTDLKPARRMAPKIPGLWFNPRILLPDELAESLLQTCLDKYFSGEDVNQVMLFERVVSPHSAGLATGALDTKNGMSGTTPSTRLPTFLTELLGTLSQCMSGYLPQHTHKLLFPPPGSPPQARQVIINMYRPGEGITPHVDLLDRFGDGIVGVSLGSGCVMEFARIKTDDACSQEHAHHGADGEDAAVFLPHGSVYVMSEEAWYGWTHGIDGRAEDWVQDRDNCDGGHWVMRSIRVSITFRWLLPGADIVGGLPDAVSTY